MRVTLYARTTADDEGCATIDTLFAGLAAAWSTSPVTATSAAATSARGFKTSDC